MLYQFLIAYDVHTMKKFISIDQINRHQYSKMNMKKRSQSSLRAKTIQSEEQLHSDNNYWMGNMSGKNVLSKVGHKITSSLLLDGNKENMGNNIPPIYQSATNLKSQESSRDHLISALQEKCKKYEKQLSNMYRNGNQSQDDGFATKQFNYTQQYYEKQIESLRNQINEQNKQMIKYQQLYSSRQQEKQGVNEGLTSRIERQLNQNNQLVKEINMNTIQIKRLKEIVSLYKSQKQTLNLVLQEKQTTIQELRDSIAQVENQKKRIQAYELQHRETQAVIKEIQAKAEKIREDNRKKDGIISVNNKKIESLQEKLAIYEQQVKQFEKSVISLKESSTFNNKNIAEIEQECEEWKERYYKAKQELQTIPQLEIKLKNSCSTIEDLRSRIKQLISTNEKLKIDLGNHQNLKKKISQFDQQNAKLKAKYQQKVQQLENINLNCQNIKILQSEVQNLSKLNHSLQTIQSEKEQHIRKLTHQMSEKDHQIQSLYDELEDLAKEKGRIKERQQKIDTLYEENKNMRESLLQKIAQIEELQIKINKTLSKNASLVNQNKKIQAMLESTSDQLNVMESKCENMKNRWQTEMGAKLGLQQKCTRMAKDISSLKSQISSLENRHEQMIISFEEKTKQFEDKKEELYYELQQLSQYKVEAELHLEQSKQKIIQMGKEVRELKDFLDDQTEKQRQNLLKIREMEGFMIQLTEELEEAKEKIRQTRQLWKMVNQCSSKAMGKLE